MCCRRPAALVLVYAVQSGQLPLSPFQLFLRYIQMKSIYCKKDPKGHFSVYTTILQTPNLTSSLFFLHTERPWLQVAFKQ